MQEGVDEAVRRVITEYAIPALEAGWTVHASPISEPGVQCMAVRDGHLFTFFIASAATDRERQLTTLASALRDLASPEPDQR